MWETLCTQVLNEHVLIRSFKKMNYLQSTSKEKHSKQKQFWKTIYINSRKKLKKKWTLLALFSKAMG